MGFSGYSHPSTSEHSQSNQDLAKLYSEGRTLLSHDGHEGMVVRSYERFLEMPVALVLAVMWVAGAAVLGSCALTLYLLASLVLHTF